MSIERARIVHTLGEAERDSMWQVARITLKAGGQSPWTAHYGWIEAAWHYGHSGGYPGEIWTPSIAGSGDVTAQTIGPAGDVAEVTFIELLRETAEGLLYFGSDGSSWLLTGPPPHTVTNAALERAGGQQPTPEQRP